MNRSILSAVLALTATNLLAAEPKDDVLAAAKKLSQQGNYSWKSSVEFGNFTGGTDGKTDKEGLIALSMVFGDNKTEAFLKGDKGAVKTQDRDWQSLAELEAAAGSEPGPRTFLLRRLKSFKAPVEEVSDLVTKAKDLKKEEDSFSGELTEAGAKDLLSFGGRRGPNAPEPKNAKGSVKFSLKDGALSKYEVNVQGTVNFGGEDRDIDRTTKFEIKDVGTTKIEVPEPARKKLS
jgi:hypothetical protein